MKGWSIRALAAIVIAAVVSAGAAIPSQAAPEDILDRLKAIPGMSVVWERPSGSPDYRFFLLTYKQPADHTRPGGVWFEQRVTLLHRTEAAPMVLYTGGYNVSLNPSRTEPTQLVNGNQLSVEQRFFSPSRPEPANWPRQLTIWQAATDHHRLFQALKPIYSAKWLSTGASKGGMTSVYNRRFYPNDIDATVAYVAPNDVINKEDSAYDRFFATVGSTPTCRNSLKALQREVLKRRAEFVRRYKAFAAENGYTFTTLKTADRALEATVLDTEWAFWQYHLESECGEVPPTSASSQELWDFIHSVADWSFYTDQGLEPYYPYYFQAATQLGAPEPKFRYLKDLRRYPDLYNPIWFIPAELRAQARFQPWAMADIDRWVRTQGKRLMFVYGGNDPWGAEPFRLGRGTRDSYWYEVAGLNHSGRLIQYLPSDERAEATAAIQRWLGVSAQPRTMLQSVNPLDTYDELTAKRPPL